MGKDPIHSVRIRKTSRLMSRAAFGSFDKEFDDPALLIGSILMLQCCNVFKIVPQAPVL
jgi:hypothetical protein